MDLSVLFLVLAAQGQPFPGVRGKAHWHELCLGVLTPPIIGKGLRRI